MKSNHWLLLNNLMNNYKYNANMSKLYADEALNWAIENNFVENTFTKPLITNEGRGYFFLHSHEKTTR